MHYSSSNRRRSFTAICANACMLAALLSPLSAAAVLAAPTDLQVVIETQNSGSNPGPFSAGSAAMINARFRIDASVLPTSGALGSWNDAADDLVLTINDAVLGTLVIHGQNGKWQQLGGDFIFGGWNLASGLTPFSIINPALSATPFVLESVSYEFRGSALFATPQDLPTALSHTQSGASDFSFLDLTLRFSNSDTSVGIIPKVSIIRESSFESVTISPVPEPHTMAMLLAGLMVVGSITRGHRRQASPKA